MYQQRSAIERIVTAQVMQLERRQAMERARARQGSRTAPESRPVKEARRLPRDAA
jgi:hypothetical protein